MDNNDSKKQDTPGQLPELDYDGPDLSDEMASILRKKYGPKDESKVVWFGDVTDEEIEGLWEQAPLSVQQAFGHKEDKTIYPPSNNLLH